MSTSSEASKEWGPWIVHDGNDCPLKKGTIVEVVSEDGFGYLMSRVVVVMGGTYSSWNWRFYPELKRITRYREKRPKGLKILEENLTRQTRKPPILSPAH